jgi:hypothetical protein
MAVAPLLASAVVGAVASASTQSAPVRADSEPKADPASGPTSERRSTMKVSLKFQDKTLTATLIDNETTRDFVSLLPLTLTMNDLFGREKYGHLPREISGGGERTYTYEVGQLVYWSPGPNVAIYYRDDGERIPKPGIIVIGKVDSGVHALNVPGAVKVKIELVTDRKRPGN